MCVLGQLSLSQVQRWASITIHFGPALVSWALTWKSDAVQAAWPGAFGALASEAACAQQRAAAARASCGAEAAVAAAADAPLALYFAWWLVYAVWLLCVGYTLPGQHSLCEAPCWRRHSSLRHPHAARDARLRARAAPRTVEERLSKGG